MNKVLGGLALCLVVSHAAAGDIKQEIIDRCRESVGKYGPSIVKACVDGDIEAYNKLGTLNKKHPQIVSRCLSSVGRYGYKIVHACAEKDIEAEEALSRY